MVSCKPAFESELLQSPGAEACSLRPRMVELSDMAKAVFRALQVALVETCPRVAALYEASVNDADLKQIEALDISRFFDLGLDRSLGNEFVKEVRARMEKIVEKRVGTVLDQMLTLVDTCLNGDGAGLNTGRVAELRKRLPQENHMAPSCRMSSWWGCTTLGLRKDSRCLLLSVCSSLPPRPRRA